MPFYIRSIHPDDGWYEYRKDILRNKISDHAEIKDSYIAEKPYLYVDFADVSDHKGISPQCFAAVELQWEDY